MIHLDSENAQFGVRRTKTMKRLRSTNDYSAICLSLTSRPLLLATNKGRCDHESNALFLEFALPVAAKCSVSLHGALFTFSLKLQSHATFSTKESLNKVLVDVNHLCLLADCVQNLLLLISFYFQNLWLSHELHS